ncbi:MAG: hypothetical protein IJ458_03985 [Clostridia bacterium]|nr:hypothetical protein [Clostridia bacterium]
MKNPELDLKTKVTFSSLEELTNHHLKNNIKLTYIELDYIFHHIVYKKSSDKFLNPTYKKLCNAIKYLMKNLTDKPFYSLVELINNDFEFEVEYNINSDIFDKNFLGDEFAGYSYTCKNPETSKFLIEFASKLETKKRNTPLENFKNSL